MANLEITCRWIYHSSEFVFSLLNSKKEWLKKEKKKREDEWSFHIHSSYRTWVFPIPAGPTNSVITPKGIPPNKASSKPLSPVGRWPANCSFWTRCSKSDSAYNHRSDAHTVTETKKRGDVAKPRHKHFIIQTKLDACSHTVWHGGDTLSPMCASADVTSASPMSANSIRSNSVKDNASCKTHQAI